jgi:drug/metabolite transporter (DMT)-like permease
LPSYEVYNARHAPPGAAFVNLHVSPQRAAWLALLVLTLVWGLNWIIMKVALDFSGPFSFSALRYAVGTVIIFTLLVFRRSEFRPPPWLPTIVIGLTQTAAFQALAQLALVTGGAGKTALLAYTLPFWIVPLAWWWLHEKTGWFRWLCIGVAAAGYVCVVTPWHHIGNPLSVVLALGSGLAWAIATVVSKRVFDQHPEVTPLSLTAWQMLIGTLVLIILALVIPQRQISWTGGFILAVLYNGVLSSSLGWVLWAFVVQRLPATVSGLTSLAVPVAGVLFGWWLLSETPSGAEWIGIALIGVALLALNFAPRPDRGVRSNGALTRAPVRPPPD